MHCNLVLIVRNNSIFSFPHVAEPPRIITHPTDSTYTVPGQQVTFTVQAAGTKPISYHWQWSPYKEGVSGDWQSCSGADTATLTIQNVQRSNEGSYRCVISNLAGSQTSKPATLAGKSSVCTVT